MMRKLDCNSSFFSVVGLMEVAVLALAPCWRYEDARFNPEFDEKTGVDSNLLTATPPLSSVEWINVDRWKFSALAIRCCGRLSNTQHHLCAGAPTSEQDQGMRSDPDVRELNHLAQPFFREAVHFPKYNLPWPKMSNLRINKQEFDDEIGRFDDEDVQATSSDYSSKQFSSTQNPCVKWWDF